MSRFSSTKYQSIQKNEAHEQFAIINSIDEYPVFLNGSIFKGYFYDSLSKIFANQVVKKLVHTSFFNQFIKDNQYPDRNLYSQDNNKSISFFKGLVNFFSIIIKNTAKKITP
ncbi:hypothetical protein ACTFIR_005854 [Dictyostelium discoideum]